MVYIHGYQLELRLHYAGRRIAMRTQLKYTLTQRVELDALHRLSTAHYAVGRYRLQLYCYKDITFAAEF